MSEDKKGKKAIYSMDLKVSIHTARQIYHYDTWYVSKIHPDDLAHQITYDRKLLADVLFVKHGSRAAKLASSKIQNIICTVVSYKQVGNTNN